MQRKGEKIKRKVLLKHKSFKEACMATNLPLQPFERREQMGLFSPGIYFFVLPELSTTHFYCLLSIKKYYGSQMSFTQ